MYKFYLKNVTKAHRYEELIKLFMPPSNFYIVLDEKDINAARCIGVKDDHLKRLILEKKITEEFEFKLADDVNELCREIFLTLKNETKIVPKWGTMTGIRPIKMYREAQEKGFDGKKYLSETYLVSDEKISLVEEIYNNQEKAFPKNQDNEVAVYIGIPFCPTKCHYCSFTSNKSDIGEIEKYLDTLISEIEFVGEQVGIRTLKVESLYVGGGTPTTLNENQLERLISAIDRYFDIKNIGEVTIEAGRPDTITEEKLNIIKFYGINRISINPQTTKEETLIKIGRKHSMKQLENAFFWAHNAGIKEINADVIAGLSDETLEDFSNTIKDVIKFNPANITVHTLALKRTSKMTLENKNYIYDLKVDIDGMLKYAYEALKNSGYFPYYLYRQKNMIGLGENIGFAQKGTEGLYNHRIMDEKQTIIALGAGGISKLYIPEENRLERVPNVSNYLEYISRIEEMKMRKSKGIFLEMDKRRRIKC